MIDTTNSGEIIHRPPIVDGDGFTWYVTWGATPITGLAPSTPRKLPSRWQRLKWWIEGRRYDAAEWIDTARYNLSDWIRP